MFMRFVFLILILSLAIPAAAQSNHATPGPALESAATRDKSVKELFEEANGYIRQKVAEFDAKKVPFSESLFTRTKIDQRQLAAKYAAAASARTALSADDHYYLGMLHWIAENLDGTEKALKTFVISETDDAARRQTARSVLIVVLAKQAKVAEAENHLAEYNKTEPTKLTERSRIGSEMAKAYQKNKDFERMAPHAETAYESAKALLSNAASRARGLDEILDAAMLVFESHRDSADRKKADAALDDMRVTAAQIGSASFYYYAVDQKIRYLIETGRKPAGLALYVSAKTDVERELLPRSAAADVAARLQRREVHYKLLGSTAPELPLPDQWFPGTTKTLAQMRGKVVLLDFWATWCTPCFEAFPALSEWHNDFQRDGLEILGVTRYYGEAGGEQLTPAAEIAYLKKFRQDERLPYDFVVMKGQSAQFLYGATALPTAVLIDRKGVVRYIEAGTSSARIAQLREMTLKLLAEK